MKVEQLCESLQVEEKEVEEELGELVGNSILIKNVNNSYEINDSNQKPYAFSFQWQTDI